MTIDLNASGTAATRGWGPGWPHDNGSKVTKVTWSDGVSPVGGVRREIAELVTLLGNETLRRGYVFHAPGCWGFANRSIAGTNQPSNHSWGLAVDINAPTNPQHTPLHTDMPVWMPALWAAYGFRWGGTYLHATKDPMHYEFMGTPADAATMTVKARAAFAPKPPTPIPGKKAPAMAVMYLRALDVPKGVKGHAVLIESGKQVVVDGPHANGYSADGLPYATTADPVQDAIYDRAYGPVNV